MPSPLPPSKLLRNEIIGLFVVTGAAVVAIVVAVSIVYHNRRNKEPTTWVSPPTTPPTITDNVPACLGYPSKFPQTISVTGSDPFVGMGISTRTSTDYRSMTVTGIDFANFQSPYKHFIFENFSQVSNSDPPIDVKTILPANIVVGQAISLGSALGVLIASEEEKKGDPLVPVLVTLRKDIDSSSWSFLSKQNIFDTLGGLSMASNVIIAPDGVSGMIIGRFISSSLEDLPVPIQYNTSTNTWTILKDKFVFAGIARVNQSINVYTMQYFPNSSSSMYVYGLSKETGPGAVDNVFLGRARKISTNNGGFYWRLDILRDVWEYLDPVNSQITSGGTFSLSLPVGRYSVNCNVIGEGKVRVYDTTTGKVIATVDAPDDAAKKTFGTSISAFTDRFVIASSNKCYLYTSFTDPELVQTMDGVFPTNIDDNIESRGTGSAAFVFPKQGANEGVMSVVRNLLTYAPNGTTIIGLDSYTAFVELGCGNE
jgi:hypothetical protein